MSLRYLSPFLKISESSGSSESELELEQPQCSSSMATRSHHRTKKTGVTLLLPYDVISHPAIVAHHVRSGATVTGTISFFKTLIDTFGEEGDTAKTNLPYTYGYK